MQDHLSRDTYNNIQEDPANTLLSKRYVLQTGQQYIY